MFNTIKKRPQVFKRLVGVSLEIFEKMVVVLRKAEDKRLGGETRGRNTKASLEDQVLLALLYLRIYTTYLYLGAVFGISESNAQRKSIKIENILIKSGLFSLPKKTLLQEEMDAIIVDATEVQRERPVRKQRDCYSGKKKTHTLKAQIVINKEGKILRTSFAKGKVHDKKLHDNTNMIIHPNTKKQMDSGYQGVQKTMSNVEIPFKSSKNKKLTKEQKQHNRTLSKQRIKVENVIREVKIFDIFDETYRNKGKRFGLRFNLVCGIINCLKGF